jgi:signal peptide peptidase SppA
MIKPWALAPGCEADARFAVAKLRTMKDREPVVGAVWLDAASPADLYMQVNGVALIGVYGLLVPDLPFHGCDWATGYNCLRIAVGTALTDPSVKAVALVIDSTGGMVAGCFELVEHLKFASRQARKPIVSIVKDTAASAAYAIATAGESISVPHTGGVGSIGVIRMHMDISGALKAQGVGVSLVHSGEHKVDGNPYEPLPAAVRDEWQEDLDAYRQLFAETVAASRPMSVQAVLDTEARMYEGPLKTGLAREIGLVDAVASPDDALSALIKAVSNIPKGFENGTI